MEGQCTYIHQGTKAKEGRPRWFGHMRRKDEEYARERRMQHVEINPLGKRKRGGLKRLFVDAVKKDVRVVSVPEGDAEGREEEA